MISQFADIFVQMVVLFAVGATGYAAKRLNLMDEDFDKKFSKLILNTALPALILASVLTAETLPSATKILWTAGVSCASYVVLVAIGFSITAALREVLPGYMIPNLFMQVEAMPLNKNGKIDRAALLSQYAAAKAAKKEARHG